MLNGWSDVWFTLQFMWVMNYPHLDPANISSLIIKCTHNCSTSVQCLFLAHFLWQQQKLQKRPESRRKLTWLLLFLVLFISFNIWSSWVQSSPAVSWTALPSSQIGIISISLHLKLFHAQHKPHLILLYHLLGFFTCVYNSERGKTLNMKYQMYTMPTLCKNHKRANKLLHCLMLSLVQLSL